MTGEKVLHPELRCHCCGEVGCIEVQHADAHDVTWCASCGTLARPEQVRTYHALMSTGHMRPTNPDLKGKVPR